MEVQLLHAQCAQRRVGSRRFVERGVIESAVADPGRARELAPFNAVREIAARRDVFDVPRLPVRARTLRRIGEVASVLGERLARECDRTVRGQRVRIDQDARRSVLALTHVQDALILQPAVAREEPPATLVKRRADLLEVEQFAVAVTDCCPLRNCVEVRACQVTFGLDPRRRLRGIDVFHPAVRVGDGRPEVRIGDGAARRVRIVEARGRGGKRGENGRDGQHQKTGHAVGSLLG
jgi:hypothetical protein